MSHKITKNNSNKYIMEFKPKNEKIHGKITIIDHTYSGIGIVANRGNYKKVTSKLKRIIKKDNLSPDNPEDIKKINSIVREIINKESGKLPKDSSKADIELDDKLMKVFYSPFPFVSYQNYITNLIVNNGYKNNKAMWSDNEKKINKSMLAYKEAVKEWHELLPQLKVKLMNFLSGKIYKNKLLIWQGFFRDNAFSPLISSLLKVIHHYLTEDPNTKETKLMISNMRIAFRVEKRIVYKLKSLIENGVYPITDLGNKYSYVLFGEKGSSSFLKHVLCLKSKNNELFNKFPRIIAIMSKYIKKNTSYFEGMLNNFVWKEKDFITKVAYFSIIFCRDNFKLDSQYQRLGNSFELGERILQYRHSEILDKSLADTLLCNTRYLIRVYLRLVIHTCAYVIKNFSKIEKSTWKFLSMFFKEYSFFDPLYGATFINLQKTNLTIEQKISYFNIAFKVECKSYKKLLRLDERELKSWILFAKYNK